MISNSDPKIMCTKALEVMAFVDQELSFSIQNNSVLPSTKKVCIYCTGLLDNKNLKKQNLNNDIYFRFICI